MRHDVCKEYHHYDYGSFYIVARRPSKYDKAYKLRNSIVERTGILLTKIVIVEDRIWRNIH